VYVSLSARLAEVGLLTMGAVVEMKYRKWLTTISIFSVIVCYVPGGTRLSETEYMSTLGQYGNRVGLRRMM